MTAVEDYGTARAELIAAALDSPDLVGAGSVSLPPRHGVGFDERVVEYPWLLAQRPFERTLDAGSTLNLDFVLDRIQPHVSDLHIVTLRPEDVAYPERGISYAYADLRDLPFRDGLYDTVVCLSTIEHVGMDNALYGGPGRAADPRGEARRAVAELRRVLAPGGRLLMTVPYGRAADHGWFRQFGRADVEELIDWVSPASTTVTVFHYTADGWTVSDLAAAADAVYRDPFEPAPSPDRAVAARGVACLHMTLPGRAREQREPLPRRVSKPWGHELWFAHTDRYAGKLLYVNAGHRLSLQYHERKDESCYLLSGLLLLVQGAQGEPATEREIGPGAAWRNEPGLVHTVEALEDAVIVEASTPELDDVVRLVDRYGRADYTARSSGNGTS